LVRPSGAAAWSKWIYFQGFYFEPRAGGEVRIFGFYNTNPKNKKTNKKKQTKKKLSVDHSALSSGYFHLVFLEVEQTQKDCPDFVHTQV